MLVQLTRQNRIDGKAGDIVEVSPARDKIGRAGCSFSGAEGGTGKDGSENSHEENDQENKP